MRVLTRLLSESQVPQTVPFICLEAREVSILVLSFTFMETESSFLTSKGLPFISVSETKISVVWLHVFLQVQYLSLINTINWTRYLAGKTLNICHNQLCIWHSLNEYCIMFSQMRLQCHADCAPLVLLRYRPSPRAVNVIRSVNKYSH